MALAIVALLVAVGGMAYLNWPKFPASQERRKSPAPPETARLPAPESKPPQPIAVSPARVPEQAKAISDFVISSVRLEKAVGSSLVYAMGSLTNNSAHQRYGVRVEIALSDAEGKPAGVSRDYRPVLEPGEVWNFRALILNSRAKSATVKEVMEDP